MSRLQNHMHIHGNESLSDESSLDTLEQSSNYTSFCSMHSNLSNTSNDPPMIPPNSIFLDDMNCINFQKSTNPYDGMHVDDSVDGHISVVDTEHVDEFLNYKEISSEQMSKEEDDDDDITVQSTTSFVGNPFPTEHLGSRFQPHCFDQMSPDETASYQIMSLLDAAGAPRICYNRLVALLKKLSKHEGFDVKKAINRETLIQIARTIQKRTREQPQELAQP